MKFLVGVFSGLSSLRLIFCCHFHLILIGLNQNDKLEEPFNCDFVITINCQKFARK
jgi:hypothetical protein